jgi:hypothetical protein
MLLPLLGTPAFNFLSFRVYIISLFRACSREGCSIGSQQRR